MFNAEKPSLDELPTSAQLIRSTAIAAASAMVSGSACTSLKFMPILSRPGGVTFIKPLKHGNQHSNIIKVQAGGGLIKKQEIRMPTAFLFFSFGLQQVCHEL